VKNFVLFRLQLGDEFRLLALAMIGEEPRHGYELMKAVEERMGGSHQAQASFILRSHGLRTWDTPRRKPIRLVASAIGSLRRGKLS